MNRARVEVRAARDDDDLDALNAGSRLWMSQDLMRPAFSAAGDVPRAMLVAELDGVPAGYAHAVAAGITDGHRGMAHVHVLPAFRRQGVGRRLWSEILQLCTPDRVPGITMGVDADDATSRMVAVAAGLRAGGLHLESNLDLSDIDVASAATLASATGLRLAVVNDDEASWIELADEYNRLLLDAPDSANGAEPTLYPILRSFLSEPWQVLVARDGRQLVGLTSVAVRDAATGRLNTMFTGVERDHRGRGLATALKATHALALRNAGWRSITTQNMEGNEPILASNRKLGFLPGGGNLDLIYDHPASSTTGHGAG